MSNNIARAILLAIMAPMAAAVRPYMWSDCLIMAGIFGSWAVIDWRAEKRRNEEP